MRVRRTIFEKYSTASETERTVSLIHVHTTFIYAGEFFGVDNVPDRWLQWRAFTRFTYAELLKFGVELLARQGYHVSFPDSEKTATLKPGEYVVYAQLKDWIANGELNRVVGGVDVVAVSYANGTHAAQRPPVPLEVCGSANVIDYTRARQQCARTLGPKPERPGEGSSVKQVGAYSPSA